MGNAQDIFTLYKLESYLFNITAPPLRGQWIKNFDVFLFGWGELDLLP